jgi:hypothetical protein
MQGILSVEGLASVAKAYMAAAYVFDHYGIGIGVKLQRDLSFVVEGPGEEAEPVHVPATRVYEEVIRVITEWVTTPQFASDQLLHLEDHLNEMHV